MSGFQVGLGDMIVNSRYSPAALVRADYLTAVAGGVDSFWVADHLNAPFPRSIATPRYVGTAKLAPKIDAHLEPWTVLGHLAARNRLRRLRLGVGVTDASRRNPAVTAQAAATLHLITHGRAILGIGVGEREGNEPYGVDWTKPVARFEEAVATIRALWDSGGALVSRESPYFPLRNAVFDLPPYRGKWPEIWIAAHGPRMLRATGRYADAWFPVLVFAAERLRAGAGGGTCRGLRRRARPHVHHSGELDGCRHRRQPRRRGRSPKFRRDESVRAQHSGRDVGGSRRAASARRRLRGCSRTWFHKRSTSRPCCHTQKMFRHR